MRKAIAVFSFILLAALSQAQAQTGDFRLVLAGDTNLHQRISIYDDPAFLKFYQRIRTADASFLNLESQIQPDPYPGPGAAWSGGIYLYSPEWLLDEFKWAGFNLIAVANNHAFDYGADGLRASLGALHKAGLVYAGAGDNLALARAPGYLDTKHGRVALLSICSTLLPGSQASEQRPDLRGRFGLNPLRFTTTYTVEPETLEVLRKVAAIGRPRAAANDSGTLTFANAQYKAGDKPAVHTEADPGDLAGLLASVRDAHKQADWVVVTIHSHEGSATTPSGSSDFFVDFAHAAIDAGADVVANHAPHDIRGIEIYKGKAIFHGLGNFAFDGHVTPLQPSELYNQRGLPLTSTVSDLWKTSTSAPANSNSLWTEKTREGAVFELIFGADGKLKQIAVDPISLLWAKGPNAKTDLTTRAGVPGPASPEAAARVIERITKLSAPLGVTVKSVDGRGVIALDQ